MSRYVILLHTLSPGDVLGDARGTHWDLMLERNGVLRTWALEREPGAQSTISARQLADHRTAYLDYEGPVSGNRGRVSRWDAGTYAVVSESAASLTLRLDGARGLTGVTLEQTSNDDDHCWIVSFSVEPTSG